MVVAITIAAIVMGIGAPAMQRLYSSSQYHGSVNDVVTLLASARYTAIRNGKEEDVAIYPDARRITVGKRAKTLPESLNIEVLGSRELNRDGAGIIRFYPDGGSSGGYVNLSQANGSSVQVQVDWLLGRVSLCKKDCVVL